jgi:hypothetical protein
VTVNSPRFTTNPPQINHQKTTLYHRLFAKTPCKTTTACLREKYSRQIPALLRIEISNTKVLLILGQIQLIVEVGGLSNDEVYTNSNRGLALRVILRHIRNFDRNRNIPQRKPGRQNRVASGGPIIPAACCSGFCSPIELPGKLPDLAHVLPLFSQNR